MSFTELFNAPERYILLLIHVDRRQELRGHQTKLLEEVKELKEKLAQQELDLQRSKEVERQRSRELLKVQEDLERSRLQVALLARFPISSSFVIRSRVKFEAKEKHGKLNRFLIKTDV